MELVVPSGALLIADVAKAAHEPAVDALPGTGGAIRTAAGQIVLHRGARADVRGGLLRITRRNAGVQRGGEERVLRVRGEPWRPRLRVRESLSRAATAVPRDAQPRRRACLRRTSRRWRLGHPSRMIRGAAGGR
jgi:hypothetical protein